MSSCVICCIQKKEMFLTKNLWLWCLSALLLVAGVTDAIHDPTYTGIKTKAYRRDPLIAQAFEQQQQQQQQQHEQQHNKGDYYRPKNIDATERLSQNYNNNYNQYQQQQGGSYSQHRKEQIAPIYQRNTLEPDCPPQYTGLLPYNYDCRRFVNCWNGRGHIQSCAPGTVFNHETLECDRPDKVQCGALDTIQLRPQQSQQQRKPQYNHRSGRLQDVESFGADTESVSILCPAGVSGLHPHPTDCTKFLNCANGNVHVQDCGPGTAYSINMMVCDFKHKVDCSGREGSSLRTAKSPDQNTTSRAICPADAVGLYPHPTDCTKFLNCVGAGSTVIQDCGPGTAFDNVNKVCDFKYKVGCGNSGQTEDINADRDFAVRNQTYVSSSDSAKVNHYNHNNNRELHATSIEDIMCPIGVSGLFPHPFDYTKFINCRSGNTAIQNCMPGTAFSITKGYCDRKSNLSLLDYVTFIVSEVSYEYSQYVTSCPPGTDGIHLYPFDCEKYVACVNGKMSILPCGVDKVYSLSRKLCSPRLQVHVNDRVRYLREILNTTISKDIYDRPNQNYVNPILRCPSGVDGAYPFPFDATKYLSCRNDELTFESCTSGKIFSLSHKQCTSKENVNSMDHVQILSEYSEEWTISNIYSYSPHDRFSIQIKCPPGVSGHFLHPFDCTKFINCQRGQTSFDSCPASSVYSISRKECVSREQVAAYDRVEYFTDTRHEFSSDTNFNVNSNTAERNNIISCPTGYEGVYPHPYDCRKYLVCTKWSEPTIETCSNGLVYSVSRRACDFDVKVVATDRSDYNSNRATQISQNKSTNNRDGKLFNGDTTYQYRPQPSNQDRWTNMNIPRPTTYTQHQHPPQSYDNTQHRTPIEVQNHQHQQTTDWSGVGYSKDVATPTQNVLYVEGSLQPNREQHSMVDIPKTIGTHQLKTEFHSYQENSQKVPENIHSVNNWHNQQHSKNFHSRHPELPNPFNIDERPSVVPTNTHYHNHHQHTHRSRQPYQHSREFHQHHPNLPNPFATREGDQSIIQKHVLDIPNPYAESNPTPSTVTFENRFNNDCEFDCGNDMCIRKFEVCDGVKQCSNGNDENNCEYLGYEVRLTGGESTNMGRIEVKILGKWGYVCDDKFGLHNADVVCRELGFKFGAHEVRGNSYYPPTATNFSFAMDEVDCSGNETKLKDCNFKGWGVNNCGPDEVVGIVCKIPQFKCQNNYWLCSTSKECIPPEFVCDNTPDCADKSDESDGVCKSPIEYRLKGGRSENEGRLEVRYRREWGTVCDDDFGIKEAQVVCNSLGYFGLPTLQKNIYGPGKGPIWLDQVSCNGNESAIDRCNHWNWGEHNCNHTEDVGIKCTVGTAPDQKVITNLDRNHWEKNLTDSEDVLGQTMLEDIGLYSGLERSSKSLHKQQRRCGHFKEDLVDDYAHPEERVINGTVAKRGRHPWQATIRTRGIAGISSHWCGAVLISKRHLLTAAHCLAGYQKGAYFIRMGDHYASVAESSEIDSYIENWYIHEKFRENAHMNNDIAVIVLKTPVKFNDYVQPICLPEKNTPLEPNRICTISGWGSVKSGVSTPSNILRAAQLPILADSTCKQPHVYGNSLTAGMFCAGTLDESVDACDGDSGGPLVCSDEDGETLYGIISWGQHCGYINKPGVYVRVEKYIDWIYEKVNFSLQQTKLKF
ncbi:uncharacterized protein LOC119671297 isoform X3 [Teleopsis dalmanni]|uniref:uncharacterized protein LOC119671297 isoform X3 n=1 Tax=Teleopsis dalmanni TaxID=139649 RepID=UPI0018CD9E98|nr:uncharacterized protein LOC119671297 isoform X3 [Teleopsis dalmanni]